MRIRLHTGPVVVGEMGGGDGMEHRRRDEHCRLPGRLAAPNAVVISGVTARLVRQAFALEDLGRHALRGSPSPCRCSGARALEAPADEPAVAVVPFLVGRDEELVPRWRRWEQTKERLGQVVLLGGTAGIGKSALTEGAARPGARRGVARLAFRCSAYHQHSALYPVITHVEWVLDVQREDTPATRLTKLEQGLRPSRLPLDEVVPLFAAFLSVPLDGRYAAPTLTPQQQKQQTLDALVAWMLEEAERQPVLVAWEDLHWADPSTLEMLGLVLEQTPTVPMLHVLTYRPEFTPPWPTRSHLTPITSTGWSGRSRGADHAPGRGQALPAEVVQHIVAKTDGVPLYVEELTKMLLQSALLQEDADTTLTGPLGSVAIPDTLQDALMARLDQLHTAKEVAQVGAVLGREFAYEMLQALAPQDEATLQAGLAQLVGAELLYQRGRPPRATLYVQARLDPGRGVCLVAQEHAAAGAPADRPAVRGALSRGGGDAARGGGAALHRRGPGRGRHPLLAAGRPARPPGLGVCGSDRAPDAGPGRADDAAGDAGTPPAGAGPPGRAGPGVDGHQEVCRPRGGTRYARARELCAQLEDTPQLFPVLRGLMLHYLNRGDVQTATQLGEQLLRLAQAQPDPALPLARPLSAGTSCSRGRAGRGPDPFRAGLALYDPQAHRALAVRYGVDLGVGLTALWPGSCGPWASRTRPCSTARRHAPWRRRWRTPIAWRRRWSLRPSLHQWRRETLAANEQAAAAMTLATEQGFAHWVARGTVLHGWALASRPGRGGPGRDPAGARRRAGHGVHAVAAVFPGPAGGGVWGRRTPRRGVGRAGRGAGRDGRHGGALLRGRAVSAQGGLAAAAGGAGCGPGRSLLPPGPRRRPPATGQILRTPRRHQPGAPVAVPGQAPGRLRPAGAGVPLVHRGL